MRRLVSIAVFLSVFAFVPLAAQDDGPNVFVFHYYKTLPGKAAAYDAAIQEYLVPLNDELVRRGHLVSYETVRQRAGTGEFTNIHIYEFADLDAVDDITQAMRDDACGAVFGGLTCQDQLAESGDMTTIRLWVRREYYTSRKP